MNKSIVVPKDQRCSPSYNFKDGSCIPIDLMVAMAKAYNKYNPDNKISLKSNLHTLVPHKYKAYLIKQLKKDDRLGQVCDSQRCWIKQDYINAMQSSYREELTRNVFRPKGPQGKFEWLGTFNVQDVMEQYEKKYPDFIFMGAVPIDFDDFPEYGIKDLDFDDLLNNKKKSKIGVVFNLDKRNESGSHWVALYADLNKGRIYFSDSNGIKPKPRIRKFMRRIARYSKKLGKNPIVDHNKTQHQSGGNACGIYSLNFIIKMLEGGSFEDYQNNKIKDKEMNINRDVYFT
uniref:Ulp1 protease n=1 Tax=Mimivirus LCMiAC01 TaxID=2506608 RepID=A0A481YZZ9_9VIRU|nr:MAG: Ulp1 protease [Mimivirus LCMiAC01]